MAAHGNATVTFGAGEFIYPSKDQATLHTVTTGQTIVLDLTAAAVGENYRMLDGKTVTCTDGTKLTFEADPTFTWFTAAADGTAEYRAGSIRIREDDGNFTDWEISSLLIDDVDEPTALTATLIDKDNGMRTMTWTTLVVAQ